MYSKYMVWDALNIIQDKQQLDKHTKASLICQAVINKVMCFDCN